MVKTFEFVAKCLHWVAWLFNQIGYTLQSFVQQEERDDPTEQFWHLDIAFHGNETDMRKVADKISDIMCDGKSFGGMHWCERDIAMSMSSLPEEVKPKRTFIPEFYQPPRWDCNACGFTNEIYTVEELTEPCFVCQKKQ